MKRQVFLLLIALLIGNVSWSQISGSFKYQAVLRNNVGELITDQSVNIRVSIVDISTEGTILYTEVHTESTNAYGVVNISIGNGSVETGNFIQINWGENSKFLKIEVDGGGGYADLGTVQLLSVPYAMFANIADSATIAFSANTANTAIVADSSVVAATAYYTNMADLANFADSARIAGLAHTAYTSDMSNLADSARIAGIAHTAYIADGLGSEGVYSTSSDTLFVVKDHSGNVVFAVFPDGAQLIVNEQAKGKVGGFAVSGRTSAKGIVKDYFYVTGDSTRVYVNDTAAVKGKVGGFAVSGRTSTKGVYNDYLQVTRDSTRIFTQDTIKGFGVKDNSSGKSSSYLQLSPINYFIGHRAGESITTGQYNTFIGYQTGTKSTWGDGNMFIGFNSGYNNIDGQLNIFIGNEVGYSFTGVDDGEENIFIGNNAGRNCTTTANSIFIGTRSGLNCGASYGNTFIGDRTASIGIAGDNNTLLGSAAGFRISGAENVFIGAFSGNSIETGNSNTYVGYSTGSSSTGSGNVFLGANAGDGELGSNKLYVANNSSTTLIYGDFVAEEVTINGDLTATTVTPSDINLKTNLTEIKSGLKLLSTLTSYYFNWNKIAKKEFNFSTDEQQIGVIAQDVEKVFPQMVVTNSKGFKTVEYSKFSPIIIEAIKEQQIIIEEQQDKITELESRLTEIETLLKSK